MRYALLQLQQQPTGGSAIRIQHSPRPIEGWLIEGPLIPAQGAELHGKGAPLQHRQPEERHCSRQAVRQSCGNVTSGDSAFTNICPARRPGAIGYNA